MSLGQHTLRFIQSPRSELLQKVQAIKLGCTDYPKQALAKIKDLPLKIVASGHGQFIEKQHRSIPGSKRETKEGGRSSGS